jgi:hypothetical protein
MILFRFDHVVHEILNYTVKYEDIVEAEQCAKKMKMIFPKMWKELQGKSMSEYPQIEALAGTWVPRGTSFAQVSNKVEGY